MHRFRLRSWTVAALVPFFFGCSFDGVDGGEAEEAGSDRDSSQEDADALTNRRVYTFQAQHSRKCLTIGGGGTTNGAPIQQAACDGSNAQKFRVTNLENGFSTLENVRSRKCLDVAGASREAGAPVIQYTCTSGENQQWRLDDLGGGVVKLVARHSGQVLDIARADGADGAVAIQWAWSGSDNERFLATRQRGGGGGTPAATPVADFGQLRVVGTRIQSADGRNVQLEGASSMWLNWDGDGYSESRQSLTWMRDNWKLTVIRAAMGVAPDGAYLSNPARATAQVERIIENAIEAGVYVIVDWHDHEAQLHTDQAVAFFGEMARKWGSYPNVIWETFNEPLGLNWNSTLKPYHERVVAAIRRHDPDNLIVLGTPTWSQDVDAAARSPLRGANLLYSLHFYACSHRQGLRDKARAALSAGLPLFVTEWGATHADGGLDGVVCRDEAIQWHNFLKDNGISWAAWKLIPGTDSSNILKPGAPVNGPWTDAWLHGHGPLVRDLMID